MISFSDNHPTGRANRLWVYQRTNGYCYLCGRHLSRSKSKNGGASPPNAFWVDHINGRKYSDSLKDCWPACHLCNQEKGEKTLEEYREYLRTKLKGIQPFTKEQERFLIRNWPDYYKHLPTPTFYFEERHLE